MVKSPFSSSMVLAQHIALEAGADRGHGLHALAVKTGMSWCARRLGRCVVVSVRHVETYKSKQTTAKANSAKLKIHAKSNFRLKVTYQHFNLNSNAKHEGL